MLRIRTIPVTPFEQNCRVLLAPSGHEALIVDPGGDVPRILDALPTLPGASTPVPVTGILLTHAHIDHAGGVAVLIRELLSRQGRAPTLYGHAVEKAMRASIGRQALMFGLSPAEYEACPEPDVMISDGDRIPFGGLELHVLFTPGHSPGHISCFIPASTVSLETLRSGRSPATSDGSLVSPVLLAGDALFAGSIGRTDLPGGDHSLLIQSIRSKLLPLPGDTLVLSGHGPNTTIQREATSNPFLR